MELLYDENDKQDSGNYRAGVTKACGSIRGPVCLFFVLSMIPIILLLLAIIQYTPVTKADVMTAVVNLFPETNMQDFMVGIVNEVYNQSKTVIPITAIVKYYFVKKLTLFFGKSVL